MKVSKISLLSICFAVITSSMMAQIGIGTTTPDSTAELEVYSTNKGLLPPRISNNDILSISNPAEGLMIYNTTTKILNYYNGSSWKDIDGNTVTSIISCDNDTSSGTGDIVHMMYDYNGDGTANYNWCAREVLSDNGTGKTWLDRNLGAYQVATSATDHLGYGDMYQWGRAMDGHHKINWTNSTTGAGANGIWLDAGVTSVTPNSLLFIEGDSDPVTQILDWMDDNPESVRWDANPVVNNVCPTGYHIPTSTELDAETTSWAGLADAYDNSLKLPSAGFRRETGAFLNLSFQQYYWSSSSDKDYSKNLSYDFKASGFIIGNNFRSLGLSVRCIKD